MSDKIKTLFTFEIMGKPPEHIVKTLENLIEQLGKQEKINITSKKIYEPKELEEENKKTGIFTTFAEVEIEVENMNMILGITMNMLPSHVEIIEPAEFRFKNFELSSLLTELTIKIHKYDEISKAVLIERNTLIKRLQEAEERAREIGKEIKDKFEEEHFEETEEDKNSEKD